MAELQRVGDPKLAQLFADQLTGEVLFDAFSRGRYSTDASAYQIEPLGVVVPESLEDVKRAMAIAARNSGAMRPDRGPGRGDGRQPPPKPHC